MIIIIYLAIALLGLLMVLHIAVHSGEVARLIDKIPGPTPLPIIGNVLMFNIPVEKLWDRVIEVLNDYNPIFRAWCLTVNLVITRNAEDIKALLTCRKNIDKSKKVIYNGFKVYGIDMDGLFISDGKKWRQRRKLILPAFNPNLMKVYVKIMNDHTKQFIDNIKNQNTESTVIDTIEVFGKNALSIMCEAAMGADLSKYGVEEEKKLRNSFKELGDLIFYRVTRPYITDWMYRLKALLIAGGEQDRIVGTFRALPKKIIQHRREYHENIGYQKLRNIVDDVEDRNNTSKGIKRLAFLDLLLTAETEGLIDDKGIRDEVEAFMSAGYESTAIASALTLMLLAENKEVQTLAREEVTQLLDRTGGELKIDDLNGLEYLERCIKESLRLYPSVPIIGRHIEENIKFPNFEIPKGIDVMMHLYLLHRDPNYWPDPEKFDPDRFLPENSKKHHPSAYQPFSSGPRGCIGSKFAMLEIKIALACLLYNFHLEPIDFLVNMKLRIHITLRPSTPCRVRLIGIKRNSND